MLKSKALLILIAFLILAGLVYATVTVADNVIINNSLGVTGHGTFYHGLTVKDPARLNDTLIEGDLDVYGGDAQRIHSWVNIDADYDMSAGRDLTVGRNLTVSGILKGQHQTVLVTNGQSCISACNKLDDPANGSDYVCLKAFDPTLVDSTCGNLSGTRNCECKN